MFKFLFKNFIKKNLKIKKMQNVDKLKNIYQIYIKTSKDFQFAVENGFLNGKEIDYIKDTLDTYIFNSRLTKHYKTGYKNTVCEIYDKLQCNSLSKKQLLYIDNYIIDIVATKSRKSLHLFKHHI